MHRPPTLLLFSRALFGSVPQDDPGHWPHWRGPEGTGVARSAAPTHFSAEENVQWIAEIPGRGFSTPVVWGGRLFLTSAVATGKAVELPESPEGEVEAPRGRRGGGGGREPVALKEQDLLALCIDRSGGEVLWEQRLDTIAPHGGYHRSYGSYASISPITDGEHLYVSFGSFGLWCLDLEGEVVWQNSKGIPYTSNPVLFEGRLYTATDRGMLSCFDASTGEPHFLEQRIGRDSQLKASPIVAGGKLYIATEAGKVHVLEAGTELALIVTNSLPERFFVPSPIVVEGQLFLRSEDESICISESGN